MISCLPDIIIHKNKCEWKLEWKLDNLGHRELDAIHLMRQCFFIKLVKYVTFM